MRALIWTLIGGLLAALPAAATAPPWADQVTIHRDTWGVPHVNGETDAAVAFGSAWAQCEDHFFQLEDTYAQALGRYAELVGERGLRGDLEVAAFEIPASSERDLPKLPQEIQRIATAFAAGYNYFLERNPAVKPRLLERMEPWHVLAFERFMMLGRLLGAAHAPRRALSELALEEAASLGSNQWAVGPSKTRDGSTMLFINPHQPWYGSGMFTEMHVRSGEGWNFSGAMYPGAPFPTAGFNERLGWAYTVNEADIADLYRLTFDHASDPLLYRWGTGYRKVREWHATIRVRVADRLEERAVTLRASHHGPVIAREDDVHFLAARVPRLYDGSRMVQALAQTKSRTFEDWYRAASMLQLQTFNTLYADADGNIFYLYNGTAARRDPSIDWTRPVDGADPRLDWGGFHPIEELPQVLNPRSGYLQNCNSTPFATTDDDNPSRLDFPPYLVEDAHDDKRRAKVSRLLLREAKDLTFERWQELAYDTTLYWPLTEIPRYARHLETLARTHPDLHARVQPYFRHLQDWDFRGSVESTQTTLAVEWYEQLYGRGYPVETLKPEYVADLPARFAALIAAADRLRALYGDWKVRYGDVHRLQRHANQTDRESVPFDDRAPSLPVAGVAGPLGVAFTVYHTPPTTEPHRKLQYATTGASYMAVVEFGAKVRAASYLHYGQSHDPASPHFFDQAKLLSERRFKPAWLDWDEVLANTERAYRPGSR